MLQWNVFYHRFGSDELEAFNLFNHSGFVNDVREATRKYPEKEMFLEEVRKSLMYYFWSKCEYEVLICPWPFHHERDRAKKIDVYWQVLLNWNVFSEYVWANREELFLRSPQIESMSYTAFLYEEDGETAAELTMFDNAKEAVDFAKENDFDEVVNDITGEVIYER